VTLPDGLGVADHGTVRVITFDRPRTRNAMTGAMRRALVAVLAEADADDAVTAVVLTGADPAFTAGVDFTDVEGDDRPGPHLAAVDPARALLAMRTPTIAAVNGACVSGGLEVALACTFIVASERARFADTHARLGVVPAWGLTAMLPRAVGRRKAAEMSITGNFVPAAEALALGLVNHVVAHDELLDVAVALAGQVATTSAVGEILSLYERGDDLSFNAALALEADVSRRVRDSFDPSAFASAGREASDRQREG
jgi:enoyl-CoA hydratase